MKDYLFLTRKAVRFFKSVVTRVFRPKIFKRYKSVFTVNGILDERAVQVNEKNGFSEVFEGHRRPTGSQVMS